MGKCHSWLVQVKNKIHSAVNGCFGNMSYQVILIHSVWECCSQRASADSDDASAIYCDTVQKDSSSVEVFLASKRTKKAVLCKLYEYTWVALPTRI